MTDKYSVIGHPIAHSKSPIIHAEFARQTRQDMEYRSMLGSPDGFAGDVRRFFAAGGRGMNVTVPFKEQAWEMCDERSLRAENAGAVNTLIPLPGGRLHGDNTDGVGLVRDLRDNYGFDFSGKRLLLLGAGGASRGVLRSLLRTELAAVVIANRTASKALSLVAAAGTDRVRGCGLDGLARQQGFDLIINATSAGLKGGAPPIPSGCLAPGGWAYDMLYGEAAIPFLHWSKKQGASQALDGLGMLVEQAAESFFLWRGVRPLTAPVIALLRSAQEQKARSHRTACHRQRDT
jgi:shikimate dehydrogenase